MDIKRELGEKIRRIRKKRGFTQEQLAEMVDISSRNLSNIEVGLSFPKSETLQKIIESLNVSTEELFSNDHIKEAKELLADIYRQLDEVKENTFKLEKIYRMIRFLLED